MPLDPVENRKAEAKGASPQASHQSSLLCRGGRMNPSATSDNIFVYPLDAQLAHSTADRTGIMLSPGRGRRLRLLAEWLIGSLLAVLLFGQIPEKRTSDGSALSSELSCDIGLGPAEGAEARPLSELSGRVLLRLEQAERKETDPHYRDDIRIAWITVLYALRSEPQPHVRATYAVLGVHPDQVFAKIQAFRQWVLAADYDTFFPEVNSPKKPNQSIKNPGGERGVA
jgi:hypothetical protein